MITNTCSVIRESNELFLGLGKDGLGTKFCKAGLRV